MRFIDHNAESFHILIPSFVPSLAQAFTTLFSWVAAVWSNFNTYNNFSINSIMHNMSSNVIIHNKQMTPYTISHIKYKTFYPQTHNMNQTSYPISHNKNKTFHTRTHNKCKVSRRVGYQSSFCNNHSI